VVYCHRLVFLGAATGISRSVARITRALGAGPSATGSADFLAGFEFASQTHTRNWRCRGQGMFIR
jgi:hypothetical protein